MRVALTILLGAAAALAQVSPSSLAGTDGADHSYYPFDAHSCRYQQLHGDQIGMPRTIHGIAFRRDATAPPTTTPLWWSDLSVRMGEGRFETSGPDFAANYSTPPTLVRAPERFVLPDWSQPPAGAQPFDLVLMFDVPFVYSGNEALVFEIEVVDNSGLGQLGAIDAFEETPFVLAPGVQQGQGCGLQLSGHVLGNYTNTLHVWLGESPVNWNTIRFLAFGTGDPNAVIPGLCAPLRVDPFAILEIGSGQNHGFYVDYDPLLVGQSLRAQMLHFPSLQLSNAVELTIPALPDLGDRNVARLLESPFHQQPDFRRGAGLVVEFL